MKTQAGGVLPIGLSMTRACTCHSAYAASRHLEYIYFLYQVVCFTIKHPYQNVPVSLRLKFVVAGRVYGDD